MCEVLEFFSADTALEQKPSDACKAKHNHACGQDYLVEGSKEVTTSQVSTRLLKSLSFKAGDGRLVSMLVKGPKKKPDGVIVEFGHSESVKGKGSDRHACILLAEPPKTVAQENDLVAKIRKLCENKPQTPVLFSVPLMRSCDGHGPKTESSVGGENSSLGTYKRFRGVLKSLKCLLRKFAESTHVCFSRDPPSTCSCWSWPVLHTL